MNILVTGGLGFVGASASANAAEKGHRVTVLDMRNPSGFEPSVIRKCDRVIYGDIRNYQDCSEACRGQDVIVHGAAVTLISESIKDPLRVGETNVLGTLNLLRAAADHQVRRFVFLSTAKVYGNDSSAPLTEESQTCPITPYALSKFVGEEHCRAFSRSRGLEAVIMRLFSVYGPDQNMRNGYIGEFIAAPIEGRTARIAGQPDFVRDFTYISDVAEACLSACVVPGLACETLNIGSGKSYRISEVAEEINRLFGTHNEIQYLPVTKDGMLRAAADISRAKSALGFAPQVSLAQGLLRTADWYKESFKGQS